MVRDINFVVWSFDCLDEEDEEYELTKIPERRNNELLAELERRKRVIFFLRGGVIP